MKKDNYPVLIFTIVIIYILIQICVGFINNNFDKLVLNLITILLFISQIIFWIGKVKIGLSLYSISLIGYYYYIFSNKYINICSIVIYFILEIYCIYNVLKNK